MRKMIFFFVGLAAASSSFQPPAVSPGRYRRHVENMFDTSLRHYLEHAFPLDELCPISCSGKDTWGSFSLTLIDALDTMLLLGRTAQFSRALRLLPTSFDLDVNVSVFESNIRVLGGLLSAYTMSGEKHAVLLELSVDLADRLLFAFDSPTGMPFGTVNLRHGVPKGETDVTCTACIATYSMEFGVLSRLTGNWTYERTALRALRSLWDMRTPIFGLWGNHANITSGAFTHFDMSIGASVDSFLEYLFKSSILFNDRSYMDLFDEAREAVNAHLKIGPWYFDAHSVTGQLTWSRYSTLQAYWPGILTQYGQLPQALDTMQAFASVFQLLGASPEGFDLSKSQVFSKQKGYPLRPELIESVYHMLVRTDDPALLEYAADIIFSIERTAKVKCGYASIADVETGRLDDRMESFFLSETLKYAWLAFDTANGENASYVTNEPHVFTTEGHPFEVARFSSIRRPSSEPLIFPFHQESLPDRRTCMSSVSLNFNPLIPGREVKQQKQHQQQQQQQQQQQNMGVPLKLNDLRLLGLVNVREQMRLLLGNLRKMWKIASSSSPS